MKIKNIKKEIEIAPKIKCGRCGHEWIPHDIKKEPTVCPSCKSPYWNNPRKKEEIIFLNQITPVYVTM